MYYVLMHTHIPVVAVNMALRRAWVHWGWCQGCSLQCGLLGVYWNKLYMCYSSVVFIISVIKPEWKFLCWSMFFGPTFGGYITQTLNFEWSAGIQGALAFLAVRTKDKYLTDHFKIDPSFLIWNVYQLCMHFCTYSFIG